MKARSERDELPYCSRCGDRTRGKHPDDGCGPYCPGCGRHKGHAEGCPLDPYQTLGDLVDATLEAGRAHQG